MVLRLVGQLGVVRGSIAMFVYVGHRGCSEHFEDFEGRRSNEKGSERVYVLMMDDVPWRLRIRAGRSKRKSSRAAPGGCALRVVGVCLLPWEIVSRGYITTRVRVALSSPVAVLALVHGKATAGCTSYLA